MKRCKVQSSWEPWEKEEEPDRNHIIIWFRVEEGSPQNHTRKGTLLLTELAKIKLLVNGYSVNRKTALSYIVGENINLYNLSRGQIGNI